MSPDPQPPEAKARRALKHPRPGPRRPRRRAQVPDRRPARRARAGQRARDDDARGRGRPGQGPARRGGRRGAQPRRAHRRGRARRPARPSPGTRSRRSRRARCAAPTPSAAAAMIARDRRAPRRRATPSAASSRSWRAGVPAGPGLVRAVGSPPRRPPRPGPDVDPGGEGGGHRRRASPPATTPGAAFHDEILFDDERGAPPRQQPRGRPRGRRHQRRGAARAGGGEADPHAGHAAAVGRPAHQGAAAGLRGAQRHLRGARRRAWSARRWWPGCSPTPLLEKFGGDSLTELLDHLEATRARWARVPRPPHVSPPAARIRLSPMPIRPIVKCGHPVLHAPSAPGDRASTATIRQLFDDMVETMYAAPGHRPGRAADRRARCA